MGKCMCKEIMPLDCPVHGEEILKGIKEGVKAMKEGKVSPWEALENK